MFLERRPTALGRMSRGTMFLLIITLAVVLIFVSIMLVGDHPTAPVLLDGGSQL